MNILGLRLDFIFTLKYYSLGEGKGNGDLLVLSHVLEIDILKNPYNKKLGVLRDVFFKGLVVQNDAHMHR